MALVIDIHNARQPRPFVFKFADCRIAHNTPLHLFIGAALGFVQIGLYGEPMGDDRYSPSWVFPNDLVDGSLHPFIDLAGAFAAWRLEMRHIILKLANGFWELPPPALRLSFQLTQVDLIECRQNGTRGPGLTAQQLGGLARPLQGRHIDPV